MTIFLSFSIKTITLSAVYMGVLILITKPAQWYVEPQTLTERCVRPARPARPWRGP